MAYRYKKKNSKGSIFAAIMGVVIFILLLITAVSCSNRDDSEKNEVTTVPTETTQVITQAETEAPAPTETKVHPTVQELIDNMTLKEKVYQMFIVTPEQLTGVDLATVAGETTKLSIEEHPVGGIVYFADNLIDREQTVKMIENTQSYSKLGLFIAVDEEGGTVARVGNNPNMGTTQFDDMGTLSSPKEAYNTTYTIGSEIKELGFNLDFAPVADVNSNPDNPVIGSRSFGSDADEVSKMVKSAVDGFNDSGMLCTLKHFPGHGDTSTDSHLGYTQVDKTLDELRALEFKPFIAGSNAGADFVMVGHLSLPQVTGSKTPATLSKEIIDLLKYDIGFEGIIITDSMEMNAITDNYSCGEAAVMTIKAGADMVLMPEHLSEAAQGVIDAVENGEISIERIDESVRKILNKKLESKIIQ